ncbi:MAG TPA: hypothetical protein VFZ26_01520 [Gemmatimonadales bacterium]
MRATVVAGALLSGLMLVSSVQAQQVSANVVIRSGPVAGHVAVGEGYSTYHRPVVVYRRPPVRRVVVVERYAPRVVVVERVHRHRPARHWKRHGFRPVTLYYVDGRYYDRPVRGHRHLREVTVYEQGGHYYHDCEEDGGRHRDWDD